MFQTAFPAHHMIVLSQTYRSTQTICRAVNALIESNSERTKKQLWTQNIEGGPIKVMVAQDAGRECDMILAAIRNLRHNQHCRWSQICVLARTRKVLTAFESVLKKAGLPVFSTAHPNSKKKLNVDKCKELQTILAIAELVSSDSVDSAFRRSAQV
jgi:superfamily I DNA/RNA helicase